MSGRDDMLRRIRTALGRDSQASPDAIGCEPLVFDLTGVMPSIASADLLPKFERELAALAGKTWRVTSLAELEERLKSIVDGSGSNSVVLSRHPLLEQLAIAERLQSLDMNVAIWPGATNMCEEERAAQDFRESCFAAGAGITGVDFVLAETGSLVLSSSTEGAQLTSLAPPVHIALYRRMQIVASLDEVLARLPLAGGLDEPGAGRSVVFVTGTSRTADIEQVLIRGVHGPREVHAILVEESCLL